MKTAILFLFCLTLSSAAAAESAVDIIKRSVQLDNRNWKRAKDYTFQEKSIVRQYDSQGKVKSTESSTRDITIFYGRPFSRLVEKDGKPLSEKEAAHEEERLNRVVEKRRRESEEENSKERRNYEKRREEQRKFAEEIPAAFDFEIVGEETIGGRDVWVISAKPRAGYRATDIRAKMLSKIKGKVWIDKTEYQWVKVEAETLETISFGLFLARLGPGAVLTFEQQRVNGELWLPAHAYLKLDARLALLKKLREDQEVEYLNYRKFQADSTITVLGEQ